MCNMINMEVCALSWFWFCMILIFVIVGLSHKIYSLLPALLKDAVVYGKLHEKTKRTLVQQLLLVPKRWFVHFYILSFVWNGLILLFVLRHTFHGDPIPAWYMRLLKILTCYPVSHPSVDLLTVLIAMTVFVVHAARRVYECLFVSVYSNSSIHVAHYITGVLFYSLVSFSVLAEAPQIHQEGTPRQLSHLLMAFTWHHAVGLLLFLWASWHHHRAHEIFASLRSAKKDANRHMIPRGDWFDYVSCPHYLAEILIYTSLAVILGGHHTTWWFALAFVVSNQTVASLEIHRWYRSKFEDYPRARRAFVPYLI